MFAHSSTGMSHFAVVYRIVPCHALYLVQLPAGEKVSSATNAIAEQAQSIQKEVKEKLEQAIARYKAASDKHRQEKVCAEEDMVMVFLTKKRLSARSCNKLRPEK